MSAKGGVFGESKPQEVNAKKKPAEQAISGKLPKGAAPEIPSGWGGANVKHSVHTK